MGVAIAIIALIVIGGFLGAAINFGSGIPGVIVPAFRFDLPAKFHATHGGGISHLPEVQGIKLIFGVYAADREPQHGVIDFNEDDMRTTVHEH